MKLQVFNGGLNVRKAPELIQPNEAVVCHNVDLSSTQVAAVNNLGVVAPTSVTKPHYYRAQTEWMPNADLRDYLEYQGKLYWTDGAAAMKYDGTNTFELGIAKPSTITATLDPTTGGLTGTYQYLYTYYNNRDGTESEPSPISADVVCASQRAHVTVTASTDPQVTHIVIYRIGGSLLAFTEVGRITNMDLVYIDTIADSALATIQLNSTLNGKPPVGLKYLTESRGTFYGAVGPRLYYTRDIGNPNYWPEVFYIDFQADITGISTVSAGVIVFTDQVTAIITGSTPSTFTKYIIDESQGCILHKSIVKYKNALLFLSSDGICTTSGGSVDIISKYKLGKQTYSAINAVFFDETYYCQLTDNSIIAFDMRYEAHLKTFNMNTTWLVVAEDIFYGQFGASIYEMFAGPALSLAYTTGNLTEGASSELLIFKHIRIQLAGTLTIVTSIDGVPVSTKVLTGLAKPQTFSVPQNKQEGGYISFAITGTGTLKELEYKAFPRQVP